MGKSGVSTQVSGKETLVSAFVVLIDSPISRMLSNFFLRVNKPSYPARLFTSEDKTIEWLTTFIE